MKDAWVLPFWERRRSSEAGERRRSGELSADERAPAASNTKGQRPLRAAPGLLYLTLCLQFCFVCHEYVWSQGAALGRCLWVIFTRCPL